MFRNTNKMKINPMHRGMQLSSILRSHNRKVKKRFLQIMFHCFKVLLVPHCFLHKTPTGIGMAWAQSGHPYMTSPNSQKFLTPPSPMSQLFYVYSKAIHPKLSKKDALTLAHTIECVCFSLLKI